MKTYRVAVLGATGAVGREMIRILEERAFPIEALIPLASERSVGKTIPFRGENVPVSLADKENFPDVHIVLGASPAETAREFAPFIRQKGAVFIDNSSAFRLFDEVPLIVPAINPEDAAWHHGILSNPNCSTIIAMTAVYAIARLSPITCMNVTTYQAVSGAGAGGIAALQNELSAGDGAWDRSVFPHPIANNLIPRIGDLLDDGYTSEEMKLQNEGRKILHLPTLRVGCTAVRVPILRCHSIAVTLTTAMPISQKAARQAIADAKGCILADDAEKEIYPMPYIASGKDDVYVGRVRKDLGRENSLSLFCCGDQLRRGAATNAVEIAELLIR